MNIKTRRGESFVTLTIKYGGANIEEDFFNKAPEELAFEMIDAAFELQKLNGFTDAEIMMQIVENLLNERDRIELLNLLTP